ncbi:MULTISPECIES: sulfatase-like hydrolase/transferase [Roseobacteraceae]|uniref:Phosphoglycerol transferase I n=1 Tax=Pseudosulfitobacter pseudonitzschiae TaxID=1402135 RepID=A0A221K2E4_9RHOB|nr:MULTISPECIES: sulfatase-like hydrolase/transferase [Roseobacteraceae]ASM73070.1 phosphoglycerol transferase I [Pseudosulfitobacter pseudonitzschiae]
MLSFPLIAFPALVAIFLIVRAFVDANVSDINYALGLLAIFAVVTLVTHAPRFTDGRARRQFLRRLAVVGVPVLLIFPLCVVVLIFGELDMAAFVFHLVFSMDGTPLGHVVPYILTVAIYWAVILASLYRLHHALAFLPLWWVAAAGLILWCNPLVHDLAMNRLQAEFSQTPSLLAEFADPDIIPANAGPKPDIIVVYLEGLEQTYGVAELGGLLDPLKELEDSALVFTGVQQAFGTGWSLGGTVATQCGVALLPQGARPLSRMADVQSIVPKVQCLTDILSARGYRSTYVSSTKIVGNTMGYYGFDNFFNTHALEDVIDRDSATTPNSIAARENATEGWGLRDQDVFEIGTAEIAKNMQSDQPYALFLATMDTHGPEAFTSPECVARGQPAVSTDIAVAVRCSVQLTRDFVHKVQQMTKGRPTRIVLTSDHLAHRNNLSPTLDNYPRRNLVMFLGADTPRVIDRQGFMPDVFPTMLDWLGLSATASAKAGIGRSLLGAEPTLTETHGSAEIDRRLKVDVPLALHIWRQD